MKAWRRKSSERNRLSPPTSLEVFRDGVGQISVVCVVPLPIGTFVQLQAARVSNSTWLSADEWTVPTNVPAGSESALVQSFASAVTGAPWHARARALTAAEPGVGDSEWLYSGTVPD